MDSSITIETLNDRNREAYCCCLEEWSDEIREAGDLKSRWVEKMKDRGLGVQIARNRDGESVGMIQYIPSEYSPVEGEGTYHIHCCWVHAYKGKGVGDWRKKGIGKALLEAAEEDIRNRGGKGVSAWGLSIPVWMKASWYRKQGYTAVDSNGAARLMWKAFCDDALPPVWRQPAQDLGVSSRNKVRVISYINGICPAANIGHERMRRILEEFEGSAEYSAIDNTEPEDIRNRGVTDALFIGRKSIPLGPPPKEKRLKRTLVKELRKLPKQL
ncbi:MAG: GNAT family N-acetyltransferase [Spirochaetales bacterium]|nr:GNAT family N-acetyltransferase [Spirochaetales bacterium]